MSRTTKTRSPWNVPKSAKRIYRRAKKQQDKQALHRGEDPLPDPRSDAYKYW